MSGYKDFAVVGVGRLGIYIMEELLKQKSNGDVDRVVVLTRSVRRSSALIDINS